MAAGRRRKVFLEFLPVRLLLHVCRCGYAASDRRWRKLAACLRSDEICELPTLRGWREEGKAFNLNAKKSGPPIYVAAKCTLSPSVQKWTLRACKVHSALTLLLAGDQSGAEFLMKALTESPQSQIKFELTLLVRGGEPVVVVDGEDQRLVEGVAVKIDPLCLTSAQCSSYNRKCAPTKKGRAIS